MFPLLGAFISYPQLSNTLRNSSNRYPLIKCKYVLIVYPTLTIWTLPVYIICGVVFGVNHFVYNFLSSKKFKNKPKWNNIKLKKIFMSIPYSICISVTIFLCKRKSAKTFGSMRMRAGLTLLICYTLPVEQSPMTIIPERIPTLHNSLQKVPLIIWEKIYTMTICLSLK